MIYASAPTTQAAIVIGRDLMTAAVPARPAARTARNYVKTKQKLFAYTAVCVYIKQRCPTYVRLSRPNEKAENRRDPHILSSRVTLNVTSVIRTSTREVYTIYNIRRLVTLCFWAPCTNIYLLTHSLTHSHG